MAANWSLEYFQTTFEAQNKHLKSTSWISTINIFDIATGRVPIILFIHLQQSIFESVCFMNHLFVEKAALCSEVLVE